MELLRAQPGVPKNDLPTEHTEYTENEFCFCVLRVFRGQLLHEMGIQFGG